MKLIAAESATVDLSIVEVMDITLDSTLTALAKHNNAISGNCMNYRPVDSYGDARTRSGHERPDMVENGDAVALLDRLSVDDDSISRSHGMSFWS